MGDPMKEEYNGPYSDIIHLEHHQSAKRPHMSMENRAAQFAPFAALTGYGDQIQETARLTQDKRELSEAEKSVLDMKLEILRSRTEEHPQISIVYFEKDLLKEGGCYLSVTGILKRIHPDRHVFILTDGTEIPICDICSLDGEIFSPFEF